MHVTHFIRHDCIWFSQMYILWTIVTCWFIIEAWMESWWRRALAVPKERASCALTTINCAVIAGPRQGQYCYYYVFTGPRQGQYCCYYVFAGPRQGQYCCYYVFADLWLSHYVFADPWAGTMCLLIPGQALCVCWSLGRRYVFAGPWAGAMCCWSLPCLGQYVFGGRFEYLRDV